MSEYLSRNMKNKLLKQKTRKIERQDLPGRYKCPTCHKVFTRLRYIRRHQACHVSERQHLCDICGKSFKTKATLVAHRRSHKARNYKCPQCPFESTSSTAIHAHRQLHPADSVTCDLCGAAYIDKSTLKKHRLVHTDPSRLYPCTHPGCTWRFKTDAMRLAHVRAHTNSGQFPCPQCGYHFRKKHHLHRHMIRMHPSSSCDELSVASASVLQPPIKLTSTCSDSQHFAPGEVVSLKNDCQSISEHCADLNFPQDNIESTQFFKNNIVKPEVNPQIISSLSNFQVITTSHSQGALLNIVNKNNISKKMFETDQTRIEVLVRDENGCLTLLEQKEDHQQSSVGLEEASNRMDQMEYEGETGDSQQYPLGNTHLGLPSAMLTYRVTDTGLPLQPHPILIIGVDGVGAGSIEVDDVGVTGVKAASTRKNDGVVGSVGEISLGVCRSGDDCVESGKLRVGGEGVDGFGIDSLGVANASNHQDQSFLVVTKM